MFDYGDIFGNCTEITYINDSSIAGGCNLTPELYITSKIGNQQISLEVTIPLTVLYAIIFVTGLIGNVAVCFVIVKHRSMHTATNYYLFNLAVSDMTLLVFGLPHEVAVYWRQYPWSLGVPFCKLRALTSEMASYVSVLTIVAFSTERYISICFPLYIYTISGLRRVFRIILVVWFVSFVAAVPFAYYTTVTYLEYPPNSSKYLEESAFCNMDKYDYFAPLPLLSTLLFFILPMSILLLQYLKMGIQIYSSTHQFGGTTRLSLHKDNRRIQSQKTVVRMLAAVVATFFLCWAPFHFQRLFVIYGGELDNFLVANEWIFYVSGILYYLSCTLNPILYNVMSARYRKAFKSILCGSRSGGKSRCSQMDTLRTDQGSCYLSRRGSRVSRSILLDTEDGYNIVKRESVKNGRNGYFGVSFKSKCEPKETPI